ncbi:hypothetical protein ACFVIN_14920 [Streptomyces prasinus]|uniref:hypothetical protein n=1 Tax=Streptomyces prasinus TaxID=67345 RepID=UPI00363D87BF
MSITRRRLGTGPNAFASTAPASLDRPPRLLPVERITPGQDGTDGEHQAVAGPTGRRSLGEGGAEIQRRTHLGRN